MVPERDRAGISPSRGRPGLAPCLPEAGSLGSGAGRSSSIAVGNADRLRVRWTATGCRFHADCTARSATSYRQNWGHLLPSTGTGCPGLNSITRWLGPDGRALRSLRPTAGRPAARSVPSCLRTFSHTVYNTAIQAPPYPATPSCGTFAIATDGNVAIMRSQGRHGGVRFGGGGDVTRIPQAAARPDHPPISARSCAARSSADSPPTGTWPRGSSPPRSAIVMPDPVMPARGGPTVTPVISAVDTSAWNGAPSKKLRRLSISRWPPFAVTRTGSQRKRPRPDVSIGFRVSCAIVGQSPGKHAKSRPISTKSCPERLPASI